MNPGVANRAGFRVQKNTAIYHDYGGFLAERKGFEPLRQFPDDRISSAARYDLFDISPI